MLLAMRATKTIYEMLVQQIFPSQQGGNHKPRFILPESFLFFKSRMANSIRRSQHHGAEAALLHYLYQFG